MSAWTDRCPIGGRCSECGLVFAWREVLVPAFRVMTDGVEHATRRPVRACVVTAWRLAFPWLLFKRLEMTHPVRWWRLGLFAVLLWAPVYGFLSLYAAIGAWGYSQAVKGQDMLTGLGEAAYGMGAPYLWMWARLRLPMFGNAWMWASLAVVVVLMPLAFLCLFQTMGRLKIRRAHLCRIWLYSLGPGLALVMFSMNAALIVAVADTLGSRLVRGLSAPPVTPWYTHVVIQPSRQWVLDLFALGVIIPALALPVWLTLFWWAAGRWYLRIPHAGAVAVMMTVISMLGSAVVVAVTWMASLVMRL